jgi:TctA family transporter
VKSFHRSALSIFKGAAMTILDTPLEQALYALATIALFVLIVCINKEAGKKPPSWIDEQY